MSERKRLHVFFSGTVQGVGFRYTAHTCARRFAVTGFVRNCSDGRVEMVAEGEEGELEKLLEAIQEEMSGYISSFQRMWEPYKGEFDGFKIERTV